MKQVLILCGLSLIYASETEYVARRRGELPEDGPLAGGDMDENGCIGSAGYTWCETKSKCLRSWEEDCETENENLLGDDEDEFGCIGSAGFVWCEKLEDCLQPWEVDGDWDEVCEDDDSSVGTTSSEDDEDDDYYYYYDRKAAVREWLIQFFAVAGPLLVCVPLIALHSRRKRKREMQRRIMLAVLSNKDVNSSAVNYVEEETIAVKETRKTTGPNYDAFSNQV